MVLGLPGQLQSNFFYCLNYSVELVDLFVIFGFYDFFYSSGIGLYLQRYSEPNQMFLHLCYSFSRDGNSTRTLSGICTQHMRSNTYG